MRSLVVACVALLARDASAQPVRVLTLRQAIQYAREHQPSLQAALARVAVAQEQAQLPRAAWSPKLLAGAELLVGTNNNTTASYGGTIGWLVPRVGGTPANAPAKWTPAPSTLAGAGIVQEIYDFGRLTAQASALDLFAKAASEDAQLANLDLTLFVEESFYAVSGAHAVLEAADAAVTRATAHRDLAKAGVDAKMRPPIELTRAEADLAKFEVDRARAQGAVTAAEAVLGAAIGAPDSVDAGADDVGYGAAAQLDVERDPAVRAANDALAAQRELTHAIEAERHPDLSLFAGITGRAGGTEVATQPTPAGAGWLPDVPNYDALVQLTWPIFDRTVDVRAETSRRIERVRAAELAATREQLTGRAAQAQVDLSVAQTTLPALQRALDAARANQDQADARFKAGIATSIELADAEALLTDAQIQLAIGQFQLARARARFARAIAEEVK